MSRNFIQEALREKEQQDAFHRWIQVRSEAVRRSVSVYDVLGRNGIRVVHGDREEQIACPFHGADRRPSARVYPESVRGPSHVWCFVCRERWDAISLWKKFTEETKFTRVLGEMERAFGIIPPERPPAEVDSSEDPDVVELQMLFETCERRLRVSREAFDMESFLRLGQILDRLHFQYHEGSLSVAKTKGILERVLDKIGEKLRCQEG